MFVFVPHLHGMQDRNVAGAITDAIRAEIPAALKFFLTVQSLRYAAMTRLTWNPAVAYEEAIALGGWTTNCNRDWYVWQTLAAIIPAAKNLAGYADVRTVPRLPGVDLLFNDPDLLPNERLTPLTWNKFVEKLIPCDLPCFNDRNGTQRPLLIMVVSVMVMHFTHFIISTVVLMPTQTK
jgi:hypothetical protein